MDNKNIGFEIQPLGPPSSKLPSFVDKPRKYDMVRYIVENEHLTSSNDEVTKSILYEMIKEIITEDMDAPKTYIEIIETLLNI